MKIAPESKAFLFWLFTDLRKDLAQRVDEGGQGNTDPDKAVGQLAIFDTLLTGLARGEVPDDAAVREYVTGLAKATDEANGYEQAVLEHQALTELVEALAKAGGESETALDTRAFDQPPTRRDAD